MKYHVWHNFITSPFEEKSSDHFKDIYKLKLLANFDISLTSFLGGVMNFSNHSPKLGFFWWGTGGTPMSSMSPLITAVSPIPHKIEKLSPPIFVDHDKIFLDIFSIFA